MFLHLLVEDCGNQASYRDVGEHPTWMKVWHQLRPRVRPKWHVCTKSASGLYQTLLPLHMLEYSGKPKTPEKKNCVTPLDFHRLHFLAAP